MATYPYSTDIWNKATPHSKQPILMLEQALLRHRLCTELRAIIDVRSTVVQCSAAPGYHVPTSLRIEVPFRSIVWACEVAWAEQYPRFNIQYCNPGIVPRSHASKSIQGIIKRIQEAYDASKTDSNKVADRRDKRIQKEEKNKALIKQLADNGVNINNDSLSRDRVVWGPHNKASTQILISTNKVEAEGDENKYEIECEGLQLTHDELVEYCLFVQRTTHIVGKRMRHG